MASDAFGNDVTLVGIPVTGAISVAPEGTALLTPEAGSEPDLALPAAFRKLGLISEDGGPSWESESEDAIKFWQSGYSTPSGEGTYTLTVKAAEYNALVRELMSGSTPDSDGYVILSAGGSGKGYVVFTEEVFKNGNVRRRQAVATVESVQLDQSTRGEVNGVEIVFSVQANPALGYGHLGEWIVPLS